jgi:competence protein ComEA
MKNIRRTLAALLIVMVGPAVAVAGPVNVNTADAETISAELKGIGITKALAIVEFREANGPFKAPEELAMVKGIGERTVEINREFIVLNSTASKLN